VNATRYINASLGSRSMFPILLPSLREPYRRCKRSSRPMMARLEMGEVLLTTRLGDVFLRFGQPILARNAALAQLRSKRVLVEARQPGSLAQREPPARVVPAGQFNLHVALSFPRPQGQAGKGVLVEIEGDAHAGSVAQSF